MRASGNAKGRLSDTEITAPGPTPANIYRPPVVGDMRGRCTLPGPKSFLTVSRYGLWEEM